MTDILDQLPDQPDLITPPSQAEPSPLDALPSLDTPLHEAYSDVRRLDPNRAAKVIDLANRLNQPEEFVDKNLEDVEQLANSPDSGFWNQFHAENPQASEWLKDRRNMAVAKDDFDNLGKMESFVKQVSTGWRKGNLEARQAELWAARLSEARQTGSPSTRFEAELQGLEKELEPFQDLDSRVGKNFHPLYQFSAQIPNLTRAFARFGAGEGQGTGSLFDKPEDKDADVLGPAAKTAAAGAAAGALAGPGGAAIGFQVGAIPGLATYAYQLEAGHAFREYSGLKDKAGNPIQTAAAAEAAHRVGLVNAALETAGDVLLLRVGAPAAKAAGNVALKSAAKVLKAAKIPGSEKLLGAIAANPKVFAGMTLGRAIREAGKLWALGEVGEISTEYLQEVGTGGFGEFAKSESGQEFDEQKSAGQILSESAGVVYPTFQAMLIPGLAGGGGHIFNSVDAMKRAEMTKEVYLAAGKGAEASKVRERLPEAHKQFVQQVTKGSPIENVFIPADAFETYFQSKKVDPETAAAELGVAEQLEVARETGGDLRIPLATWAGKFVGTEHYQGMADDVKFSPEDLTPRQSRERSEEIGTLVEQEQAKAEEAIQKDAEKKLGYGLVYDYVKQERLSAKPEGMTPKQEKTWLAEVEKTSALWASHAVAEAARRGISVEEYFQGAIRPEVVSESRPYRREVLNAIREEIASASVEKGGLRTDQEGNVHGRFGTSSSFPEYFRNKGLSKDQALAAIDKYLAGKDLTEKQSEMVRDLYVGSGYAGVKRADMAPVSEPFLQRRTLDGDISKEARLNRAKSMGFDTSRVFYHGMKTPLEGGGFSHEKVKQGQAFFFTEDPDFAAKFAAGKFNGQTLEFEPSGANIVPVYLRANKTFDYENRKHVDQLFKALSKPDLDAIGRAININGRPMTPAELRQQVEFGNFNFLENPKVIAAIKKAGHDSYFVSENGRKNIAVFDPSNIRSVNAAFRTEGSDLLFQDEQDPRGMVQFTPTAAVITLFKAADASTFLHESAHVWLKDIFDYVKANQGKLPEAYARDWAMLSEWLGVTPEQTELTVDQQEKFARGFEAYLREGKSPSEQLRKVFRTFRMWLTRIYRDIRGLDVEITDEVRAVMDRMLATEEEIAAAQREVGYEPIQAEVEGLTPEVRAKIQALQEQAHEEAIGILLRKQMDELKSERKDFLSQRREKIEKEVRAEVKKLPIYMIQDDLRAEFKTRKTAKTLAEDYKAGKLKEEQAAIFEARAELGGYSSGDEFATALIATPSLDERVGALVRERMAEYADLKDRAILKDEALQAIHNEQALELMALEREILDSLVKGAEVKLEAKKRKAAEAKVEAQAAKARAEEIVRKLNVKAATAYLPYFTAERRWAAAAAKAIATKDYEAAAIHKRQQMLNHALAIASLKAAKKVEKWEAFLRETQTKRVDLFKQEDHFHQVAEILNRVGFPRRDYMPGLKRESLSQWAARMQDATNTVNMPEWIQDESRTLDFDVLTMEQLQDVINAIKNIQSVANFEKRALVIEKGATIDEIASELALSANLNSKGRKKYKPGMEPERFDDAKKLGAKYLLSITKVQTLLRKIDGFQDFGKWWGIFWEPVYKAANKESEMMTWANDGLAKLWEPYSAKERAEMMDKKIFYPELGTSATKIRLIMMALNLGNEGNREKLFQTRPVGVEDAIHWDQQTVMALLQKHLTEKDWQFVQNTWEFINTLWPQIAELHKSLTGFAPPKVEASPFNVALSDGRVILMKGGYFPLKEDPRASARASIREQLDSPLYTEQNPGWMAVTKTGHTKERTGAAYSVSLDVTLIYRHLRDVIHDLAFRPTVIDLRRLLGDERIQQTMVSHAGLDGYQMIREWVASVAAGNVVERQASEVWERIVGALRRRTVVAALMMKPSVIIQNLSNPLLFANAVEGFGYKEAFHGFFIRGVMDYLPKTLFDWKAQKELKDQVYRLSPFMRDKRRTPDFSLHETHNKLFGKDSRIQEFATALMAGSDELTSIPMWLEAYNVALDRNMESDEAIRYADALIDRVLGSSRKYDAPPIQRGGELAKSLSMFYTFLNTEYNRWAAEAGQVQIDQKHLPRFLGFIGSRLLIFVPISALLSGKTPGEDDDKLKFWLKEILGYPFNLFPGGREMASVALDNMLGLKSFGYKPSPAVGAVEATLMAGKAAGKVMAGEAEPEEFLQAASKSGAYLFPYPDQFNAWFWNAYDYAVNGMDPQFSDFYRRRPKKER